MVRSRTRIYRNGPVGWAPGLTRRKEPAMKRTLTFADVEAQSALELPSRELMGLVTVVLVTKTGDINILTFDDLVDAQRFCIQAVTVLSAQKCEITGGGGQHS